MNAAKAAFGEQNKMKVYPKVYKNYGESARKRGRMISSYSLRSRNLNKSYFARSSAIDCHHSHSVAESSVNHGR